MRGNENFEKRQPLNILKVLEEENTKSPGEENCSH